MTASSLERGALGYLVDRQRRQALLVHHQNLGILVGIMASPAGDEPAAHALTRTLEQGGLDHLEATWTRLGDRTLPSEAGVPVLHVESWVAFVDLHEVPWTQGLAWHPMGGKSLVPLDPMAEEDLGQVMRLMATPAPEPEPRRRRLAH